MRKPPSDKPPKKPAKDSVPPSPPKRIRVKPNVFPFGMSAAQYANVTRAMRGMVRFVCRHSGVSPEDVEDVLQQSFVKAIDKPETERPSIQESRKFCSWMVTMARFEAQTLIKSQHRQAEREVHSAADIAETAAVPPSADEVEARKMLDRVSMKLEPEDEELLQALYGKGKTIGEIANERQEPRSTVDSRHQRLLKLLYAAMQALVAALVLVPKKARAFVAHVKQQTAHVLVQTAHVGGAVVVTGICGMLVPTGSFATTKPVDMGLTRGSTEQTNTTETAYLSAPFVPEVEPEEPKGIDTSTNECSSGDMKCTKTSSSVAENLMPMTFVLGVALSQVACAGSDQQTPPHQPDEEVDQFSDPYEVMCQQERARGNQCGTREDWYKRLGIK